MKKNPPQSPSKNLPESQTFVEDQGALYLAMPNNDYSLINFSKKGVNYKFFQSVLNHLPLTIKEWSEILQISDRTLQRYEKENAIFNTTQSEHILKIDQLKRLGQSVFGAEADFNDWLHTESLVLGLRPLDLLDTQTGIQVISNELNRIKYGVYA
jgi:putative toxin-antitoxin system antitoxin component (TIGR02293 family)